MRAIFFYVFFAFLVVGLGGCTGEDGKADKDQKSAKTEKRAEKKKSKKFKSPFAVDNLPTNTIVMTVNGIGVTQQEYADWLRVKGKIVLLKKKPKAKTFDIGQYAQSILENRSRVHWELIRCELMNQYAEKNGLKATDAQILKSRNAITNIIVRYEKAFPKPGAFEEARDKMVLERIVQMSALDEACLRHSTTNDLTRVTDEEIDAQLKWIDEWNKTADQKDAESVEKAKKAKQEILAGTPFAEVAKKYSEIAPNEGEDWETFELDEFQADEPIAQWLISAKQGDISDPIELEDGYSIIGLRQLIEEQPEGEGEKVVRSYELVRCTFHAYEKIDVPENREQLRRDMLAERKRAAFQELGMKLMENAKIEYPQGTAIFEVAKPKKKKKSHKKPAKAYNKEGGKQNGEVTNTVTAVRGAKGSAQ